MLREDPRSRHRAGAPAGGGAVLATPSALGNLGRRGGGAEGGGSSSFARKTTSCLCCPGTEAGRDSYCSCFLPGLRTASTVTLRARQDQEGGCWKSPQTPQQSEDRRMHTHLLVFQKMLGPERQCDWVKATRRGAFLGPCVVLRWLPGAESPSASAPCWQHMVLDPPPGGTALPCPL